MKTTKYLVFRYGANGANQHLCERMVLGIITARSWRHACEKAQNNWTCYNNQHFTAIALSKAKKGDLDSIYGE